MFVSEQTEKEWVKWGQAAAIRRMKKILMCAQANVSEGTPLKSLSTATVELNLGSQRAEEGDGIKLDGLIRRWMMARR